jgi:hypothetical protein
MLKGIKLSDRIQVPSERTLTDAGQMHVPCKFARTGTQLYTAAQLGLVDEAPNKIVTVYRDEADVFAEDSMATFRSAPVTIGHPKDAEGNPLTLTVDNSKELQVGMLEGMPVRDEDTLGGTLILTAKEAIDTLEDGTQELSAGYTCDIEDVDGKLYQRNIKANHIAIVAKGRAGSSCRISDEAEVLLEDAFEASQVELADTQAKLAESVESHKALEDAVEAGKVALADAKVTSDEAEVEFEKVKLELADAKLAATEGVTARCVAIENARLIADMRDISDKSVAQIERMVVEDQMPEKDLTSKSEAYVSAMFEILVDASKGETPMGKLLKSQAVADTKVEAKPVNKVEQARLASIARNAKK